MSDVRSVVVHGHFYQPPRENPFTGVVEREANAAPDHDWNARITRECYAPLAAIPLGHHEADPVRINAYRFMSFDVGPTLLAWFDSEAPAVRDAMVEGDRAGRERLGFGNAMAMPYHHLILPLASRRDKATEVRWGLADFRRRFGREAEGLWLPETAVDHETLDVLAEAGVAFTVLAPHQVTAPPPDGRAGRVRTSGGRSIAVFVYDGRRSHDVAFGKALEDSARWETSLLGPPAPALVSVATDGETYGHHHRFADLALGALLHRLAARPGVRLENFASALAAHAPQADLELVSPSSWSCLHGVERWRADCGCRILPASRQGWRAPLRAAVDWLVGEVHAIYGREGAGLPGGPWPFRDAAGGDDPVTAGGRDAARLIELERSALKALTSCGWFFDDFAGLEGRQVLRYAARAINLAGAEWPRLQEGFMARLEGAVSNDPAAGTARDFYRAQAWPE